MDGRMGNSADFTGPSRLFLFKVWPTNQQQKHQEFI